MTRRTPDGQALQSEGSFLPVLLERKAFNLRTCRRHFVVSADSCDCYKSPHALPCREEGSNGDREMAAAVHAAGMEPWDITMSDLLAGRASLDSFAGIVFVGGFSYADVLDSAKGWAGTIRRNSRLWAQFQAFYDRCALALLF